MRKYIAEFIGTAVLVIFGCGSAVAANALFIAMQMGIPQAFTTLLISFAFGLSIVAMAYSIGNISGCHINPAVSIAMLVSKRMGGKDFVGYVIAQLLGGIAGAAILSVIFGGRASLGANGFDQLSTLGIDMGGAILVEIILTFVFVIAVLGVTEKVENSAVAGLVIGLSLTLVHIFGLPFTGTSVNPARSLGPALLQGGDALSQVWVFIVAPVVGAIIAALVYTFLRQEPKKVTETDVEEVNAEIATTEEAVNAEIATTEEAVNAEIATTEEVVDAEIATTEEAVETTNATQKV